MNTALVTGASSGIGAALAKRLAHDGTTVLLAARRIAELEKLASEITSAGGKARAVQLDVADADATVAAIRALDDETGGIDLVIANAGVGDPTPAHAMEWSRIATMCRVNFDGAIATLSALVPRMVERKRGHLVAVSSLASYTPLPASAAYNATKAGLSMFVECLRLDLRGTGVYATTINPGFVKTAITDKNDFTMPFLMTSERAADLIARRLPSHPATIDFPLATTLAVKLSGALPRFVRDRVLFKPTR